MYDLEYIFNFKVNLLIHGCRIDKALSLPKSTLLKKIHLYAHSDHKSSQPIPDDLILPGSCIARIRYRDSSYLVLQRARDGYEVLNERTQESIPVTLVESPKCSEIDFSGTKLSSICSFLGVDLLGITPSNYCFYFQDGKQCRFCEILPTFKKEVEFRKSFKSLDIIENAILAALKAENRLRFIAITTGNIHSYDATLDYFIQIGERLQKDPIFKKAKQVLATLMPPDDLSKIAILKEKGFTKIYFPLEVFEENHFSLVCPGKAEYGYRRILNALDTAVKVFGPGNVYTNFVYGIQSLNSSLDPSSYHPEQENKLSMKAVEAMLNHGVIPAFTLYHYAGYNAIGNLQLDAFCTANFFKEWGNRVRKANIVPQDHEAVLFSPLSLSNTLFNDGFGLTFSRD